MKIFPLRMWMCVVSVLISSGIAFGIYLGSDTYVWEGEAMATGVTTDSNSNYLYLQMAAPGRTFRVHNLDIEAQYLNDVVTKQNHIRAFHCRVTASDWGNCAPIINTK